MFLTSIHTWSHNSLTTLTNEQVVAEIAWTMKAFQDVLGVTPNCVRPPYGGELIYDQDLRYLTRSNFEKPHHEFHLP